MKISSYLTMFICKALCPNYIMQIDGHQFLNHCNIKRSVPFCHEGIFPPYNSVKESNDEGFRTSNMDTIWNSHWVQVHMDTRCPYIFMCRSKKLQELQFSESPKTQKRVAKRNHLFDGDWPASGFMNCSKNCPICALANCPADIVWTLRIVSVGSIPGVVREGRRLGSSLVALAYVGEIKKCL